jgi:hypothetical protein
MGMARHKTQALSDHTRQLLRALPAEANVVGTPGTLWMVL